MLQGRVSIQILTRESLEFLEILVYESGAHFGEASIEANKTRSASVQCKEPCHFLKLEKKTIKMTY
jgi:CRP-like cAMP-binding protein